MERMNGRTAIVTGGSSGIGRAIALKLAEEGANVVVADLHAEPNLGGTPVHEEIRNNNGNATFIDTDVSDEGSVQTMVQQTVETYGQIDVLVNNAGIYHAASITEENEEDWNTLLDVNMKGTFLCSKYVLSHMVENDVAGDIVNIGSIAGLVGYAGSAAYCASKGGVVELTRQMATDYGHNGININAVDPGVIRTAMTKDLLNDQEIRENMESNTLTPRLGEPEDIANAVVFLASSESDFIMGANLAVDGGWTAK